MKTRSLFAFGLLLASFAFLFFVPLWDTDLWWHLASGKYIVQNMHFFSGDPFTITGVDSNRSIILNGYWLSQVFFYFVCRAFGYYGLIFLRDVLLLSILVLVLLNSKESGAKNWATVVVLFLAGVTATYYTGLRPQLFSFLFSVLLVARLEKAVARGKGVKSASLSDAGIPFIMVLWANMHGGFMMGAAILIVYLLAALLEQHKMKTNYSKGFFWVLILGIAASLLNPNTYKPFLELFVFEGSTLQQRTSEYMSPVICLIKYHIWIPSYWVYLFLSLSIVVMMRSRLALRHMVLILFMAAISLRSYRYIPFFVFTTAPFIASQLSQRFEAKKSAHYLSWGLALIVLGLSLFHLNDTFLKSLKHPLKEHRFPEKAAEFIRQARLPSNIFNHFDWGGYLIWKLFPEYKVFIDGRALNGRAFYDYTWALWSPEQAPGILDRYGINTVIVPWQDPWTRETYVLPQVLARSGPWRLVYEDNVAVIYTRTPAAYESSAHK